MTDLEAVLVHILITGCQTSLRFAEQYEVLKEKEASKTPATALRDEKLVLSQQHALLLKVHLHTNIIIIIIAKIIISYQTFFICLVMIFVIIQ